MKPRVSVVFVAYLTTIAAIFVGSVALFTVTGGLPRPEQPVAGTLDARSLVQGGLVTESVLLLNAVLFARPLSPERFRLGPSPARGATLAAIVVGTLALGGALDSLAAVLGYQQSGTLVQLRKAITEASGGMFVAVLLVVGLFAGVAEELFFRGFMQTRLAERWSPRVAVAVTALAFGLLHFDPVHSLLACGLGLWLGLVVERAGSIRPAIAAHVVNNLFACVFPQVIPADDLRGKLLNGALGLVSAVIFAACARHVVRALPPPALH